MFIMLPLVLIIIAIVAIAAITGLVNAERMFIMKQKRMSIMKHIDSPHLVLLQLILVLCLAQLVLVIVMFVALVSHAPSSIDSYDLDSLEEVAEGLVVEDLENYTIASFVTKRRVIIHNLPHDDKKKAMVFIRVTRDDWAFFRDGDGVQIPEKAEVKIYNYNSDNVFFFKGDEFTAAYYSRFWHCKLVMSIEEIMLAGIAETIEPIRKEYGKGLAGFNLTLNKDATFIVSVGRSEFVAIEIGEGFIVPDGTFTLPKGARLILTTYS
jgi:hypothetical protein